MDTTYCPECGALAVVEWRGVWESTDEPVEHAKVRCAGRHWFLLPIASLPEASRPRMSDLDDGRDPGALVRARVPSRVPARVSTDR